MTMKTLLSAALLALAALGTTEALAHGDAKAKHGGVVQVASDLSFELVGMADGAAIYVEDHGKPMVPAGLKGKLTVLKGAQKSEADLVAVGDKLEAKGIQLTSGAKVVAAMSTANAKAITVRFTVK